MLTIAAKKKHGSERRWCSSPAPGSVRRCARRRGCRGRWAGGNIWADAGLRRRRCFPFACKSLLANLLNHSQLSLDQNQELVNFFNNPFLKNFFKKTFTKRKNIGILNKLFEKIFGTSHRKSIYAPVAQLDRVLDSDVSGSFSWEAAQSPVVTGIAAGKQKEMTAVDYYLTTVSPQPQIPRKWICARSSVG